jgi:hypothetical protein
VPWPCSPRDQDASACSVGDRRATAPRARATTAPRGEGPGVPPVRAAARQR